MTIQFDDGAADSLISAARSAADTLRGQAGPRRTAAEDAATDFAGAYARSFATVCTVEASDRGKLAGVLDSLATQVEDAKRRAQEEKDRIAAHDAWQDREDLRDRKRVMSGAIGAPTVGAEISDPEPSNEPNPAPTITADFATSARDRGASGGSGGVSSAVPERLTRFAEATAAANRDLSDRESRLSGAWSGFTSQCSWVNIGSATFTSGFSQLTIESDLDAEWARTLASSFEEAGGGGVLDSALGGAWSSYVEQRTHEVVEGSQATPSEIDLLLQSLGRAVWSASVLDTSNPLSMLQGLQGRAGDFTTATSRTITHHIAGDLKFTRNRHVNTDSYSKLTKVLRARNDANWSARPGMEDVHARALKFGKVAGRANVAAGVFLSGASQWQKDAGGDFTTGERVGRTATRAGIVGASAWAGAAGGAQVGAMAGMLFGPAGAVVGGIAGGIIGGVVGSGVGDYLADKAMDLGAKAGQAAADFGKKVGEGAANTVKQVGEGLTSAKQAATVKIAQIGTSVGEGIGKLGDALSFFGKKA
ncbi:hypothetical protein JD292_05075 [Leucobacter sp. CSA2]|uniref:Uncharacterized protein n=1 Tax=Leucobacter edaphi TaxID=2796472 RepID=A0A934UW96_9MICO|nr:hypothetical protein [Leucobacter edaphi]MBK0421444.1 hypothetical protein [Leucobacter edaphi]